MKETSEEEGICVCVSQRERVWKDRESVCDIKREERRGRQDGNSEKER